MRALFQHIEELIPTLPGWGEVSKAQTMAAMVIALRPEVTCEIGVYGGRTFFGLALAHKFIGKGRAIGIDPWSNAAAVEGYTGENREFWKVNPLDQIHDDFTRKCFELSVSNVVDIRRAKSDDVVPPQNIGVLSIDGQHADHAIRDVKRYAPNVTVGGFVLLDDLDWANDGTQHVKQAERDLMALGFEKAYALGTGAAYVRVK